MEPLVEKWDILGYGFTTPPIRGLRTVRITHVIWADNIFLLAKTEEEAQEMMSEWHQVRMNQNMEGLVDNWGRWNMKDM